MGLQNYGYDLSGLGVIPLISFSVVLFAQSCGVVPLPFVVISEILPKEVNVLSISVYTTLMMKVITIAGKSDWINNMHGSFMGFRIHYGKNFSNHCRNVWHVWMLVYICWSRIYRSSVRYGIAAGNEGQEL